MNVGESLTTPYRARLLGMIRNAESVFEMAPNEAVLVYSKAVFQHSPSRTYKV
jgi:hypothetical protein